VFKNYKKMKLKFYISFAFQEEKSSSRVEDISYHLCYSQLVHEATWRGIDALFRGFSSLYSITVIGKGHCTFLRNQSYVRTVEETMRERRNRNINAFEIIWTNDWSFSVYFNKITLYFCTVQQIKAL